MKKIISFLCLTLFSFSTSVEAKEYELGAIAQNYYSDLFLDHSPFGNDHKAVRGFVAGNIYASLQSKFETTKPKLSGTVMTSFNIGVAFHSYLNKNFNNFLSQSEFKEFIKEKKVGAFELMTLADVYYAKEVSEQIFLEALDALLLEKFAGDIGRKLTMSEKEKLKKIKEVLELKEETSSVSERLLNEENISEQLGDYMNGFEVKMKEVFSRRKNKSL